jgi:TATA-binding protein-associated factor
LDLQTRSAVAVSSFIDFCALHGLSQPPDKIVKNLCTFLCQDVERTPTFAYQKKHLSGILSFQTPSKASEYGVMEDDKAESREKARLSRRGAGLAFIELSTKFGEKLLEVIPKMWHSMAGGILIACSTGTHIVGWSWIFSLMFRRNTRLHGRANKSTIWAGCH